MARVIELRITKDRCKGCSFCIEFCPQKVLVLGDEVNQLGYNSVTAGDVSKCTGCGVCYLICPDLVFEIAKGESI